MKKLGLILLFTSILYVSAFESNFMLYFNFEPSSSNTKENIQVLSVINDRLYLKRSNKIYTTKFTNINDVEVAEERADFEKLKIDGIFSEYKNLLYYSSDGILYSMNMNNGTWSAPQELAISGYEKKREMGKGSSLYYGRWRYKSEGKTKEKMYNPFISNHGKRLYFSSEMEGGKGGKDIWYMELNEDGNSWSEPINMREINSDANEDFPFVDNNIFYFSSDRTCKYKGLNIYKKFLLDNSKVSLLDEKINSHSNEMNFVVTGGIPFFISDKNGTSQLYYAKFQKEEE